MESNSSSEETSEPQDSESQSVAEPKRAAKPTGTLRARLFALAFAFGGLFLAVVLMGAERPLPGGAVGAFFGCLVSTAGFLALAAPVPRKPEQGDAVAALLEQCLAERPVRGGEEQSGLLVLGGGDEEVVGVSVRVEQRDHLLVEALPRLRLLRGDAEPRQATAMIGAIR